MSKQESDAVKDILDYSNERPNFPMVAPAVTRNMMFRLNPEKNPRWKVKSSERALRWKEICTSLKAHVESIMKAFGDNREIAFHSRPGLNLPMQSEGTLKLYLNRSCLIEINPIIKKNGKPDIAKRNANSSFDKCRLRIRIDMYNELISIGYFFDKISGDLLSSDYFGKIEDIGGSDSSKSLMNCIHVDDRTSALAAFMSGRNKDPDAFKYWDGGGFGALHADFRGIVLQWKQRDSWIKRVRRGTAHISGSEPEKKWITAAMNDSSIGHAIKAVASPHSEQNSETRGGEAIICSMLNGEAIYAAELGKWEPSNSEGDKVPTVRHLIVYNGDSAAQLGRLQRRLHVLGELRQAALFDYSDVGSDHEMEDGSSKISSASRKIRALGKYVDHSMQRATAPETGRFSLSIEKLNRFVAELNEINVSSDGSLLYRVTQADYYAKTYRDLVKHLRVGKIGRYQPYDKFVERYFYHMFDRIERVGKRYEQMGRRIDRLLFFKEAEGADRYQKTVEESLARTVVITNALNENAARAGQLLETAENIGWLIAAYYIGSALKPAFVEHGEVNMQGDSQEIKSGPGVSNQTMVQPTGNTQAVSEKSGYSLVNYAPLALGIWVAVLVFFAIRASRVARKAMRRHDKARSTII